MEKAHQAVLDSLPPPRRGSKLEPYAALIRALRARGRSYREIVTILRERCGLDVAMHTVYHFVRARAKKEGAKRSPLPPRRRPSGSVRSSSLAAGPSSLPSSSDRQEDVRARIEAVKRRAPAQAAEPKVFEYDENKPLQLIADNQPRKR